MPRISFTEDNSIQKNRRGREFQFFVTKIDIILPNKESKNYSDSSHLLSKHQNKTQVTLYARDLNYYEMLLTTIQNYNDSYLLETKENKPVLKIKENKKEAAITIHGDLPKLIQSLSENSCISQNIFKQIITFIKPNDIQENYLPTPQLK